MPDVSLSLAQARVLFPIIEQRAYLFSGGLGPAATPVREAHNRWTDDWTYHPATYPAEWELARARFATWIGAVADEIAVIDHTSRGANLIVQMLPAPPSANVVVYEYTFPSSLYPWLLARNPGRRFTTLPRGTRAFPSTIWPARSTTAPLPSASPTSARSPAFGTI